MHEFVLRHKTNGFEMYLYGIGKTPAEAKTKLLIYNLARTDFTVWELIG